MAYTIEEQYGRDIDWYFKDANDNMFHVASAGGRLPDIIVENDFLNNSLHSQIQSLPLDFDYQINPNLDEIKNFETSELRQFYLEDFIEMAQKGFVSIDKTILGNFDNTIYHLVAWPINYKGQHNFAKIVRINEDLPIQLDPYNLFQYF